MKEVFLIVYGWPHAAGYGSDRQGDPAHDQQMYCTK